MKGTDLKRVREEGINSLTDDQWRIIRRLNSILKSIHPLEPYTKNATIEKWIIKAPASLTLVYIT